MYPQQHFSNCALFLLLAIWIKGMAGSGLEYCEKLQQDIQLFPAYNCSVSEDSAISIPMSPNDWTYVNFRNYSSSGEVRICMFTNGVSRLFSSKFSVCAFSNGNLMLGNFKEDQQGEYVVTVKETVNARFYVYILSGQQINRAASTASMLPTSPFLLSCVLLVVLMV